TIVTCSSGSVTVTFATDGYTGSVTYTVTGDGTNTVSLDGAEDLEIIVSGVPDDTKFITITDVNLVDVNGNTCITFDPTITTLQWVDEPSVSDVDIDVTDACEGDAVQFVVNGVGETATVSLTNFLGVTPTTVDIGTPYTVYVGSYTNDAIITVTAAQAGDCEVEVNAGAAVNVLQSPEITDLEYVCETPGNPSSDIEITVTGTPGAVVTLAADEGSVILTESPSGTYT